MIKSINDTSFENKKVLVRVDFNVPIDDNLNVTDDMRVVASLPTIDKIIKDGGIPILMSHLGRPKGKPNLKYSLKPVANLLKDKYGYNLIFAEDCIGDLAHNAVNSAKTGDIVLLENLRFYADEEENSPEFSKKLAELADVYVNDAFGSAHRAHASTEGVTHYFTEKYAGLLMQKELKYLGEALNNPKKPFVAIIGGAKISGKIDVLKNLLNKCDSILIGGGMMFTFLKSLGKHIGKSLIEEDKIEIAKDLIQASKDANVRLILPVDVVIANEFNNEAETSTVSVDNIPDDAIGMDIGPDTIELFKNEILKAKTVFWNGPMGVFEMPNFAKGTFAIADTLKSATENGAITVVGGGDSASAINSLGYEKYISHVSTGGGASLEFLEGKELPGVKALER
ncbi:MAG: phosphoglycerate kinase [Candidatus Kapaibacteriota bacterium]